MLVKIETRILIFPGTDFYFPSTSVPPGTFFRLWQNAYFPAVSLTATNSLANSTFENSLNYSLVRNLLILQISSG